MGTGGPDNAAAPAAEPAAAPAPASQDAATPAAAPSGQTPAAAAPAATQTPPAESQAPAGAPPEPTDEEIWNVLTSPKAQASIQMVAGMIEPAPGQPAANGAVVAPAAPAAAPSATDAQVVELQRRAGEGDEDAKASLYDMRVVDDAKVAAQTVALGEARKDVMGKLFQTPALANLSAAEQGRLVTALATGGEAAFMDLAMQIGVQRAGGTPAASAAPAAAAPPAQAASAAAGYQAVQTAQVAGAPVIPSAAAPPDGAAPLSVEEGKSATDVLDDFFASQGQ